MNYDLISREALWQEVFSHTYPVKILDNENKVLNEVLRLIRNAPTVESEKAKESEIIKAYTKGFDTGVETVKNERPKGEWLSRSHGTGINYGRECSLCGKVVEFSENFCPNCGADMRKGGAE